MVTGAGIRIALCCVLLFCLSCDSHRKAPPLSDARPESMVKPAPDFAVWHNYTDGLALASAHDRHTLLCFSNGWNPWCKIMDAGTFAADSVRLCLDAGFVRIGVDIDSDEPQGAAAGAPSGRELGGMYGVSECPHVFFLAADGRRITHLVGLVEPELFCDVLDYVTGSAFRELSFAAYRDTLSGTRD